MKLGIRALAFILLSSWLGTGVAVAGTGTRGGDIEESREIDIRGYMASGLKAQLSEYFKGLSLTGVAEPLKSQLTVLKNGIEDDLKSEYVPVEHCAAVRSATTPPYCFDDFGTERSMSTHPSPRSPIYFNLSRLARLGANHMEILALVAHEHARHFGFESESPEDRLNPIYDFVSKSLTSLSMEDELLRYFVNSPEYAFFRKQFSSVRLKSIRLGSHYGGWSTKPDGVVEYPEPIFTSADPFLVTLDNGRNYRFVISSINNVTYTGKPLNLSLETLIKRTITWTEEPPLRNEHGEPYRRCGCQMRSDREGGGFDIVGDWIKEKQVREVLKSEPNYTACADAIQHHELNCRDMDLFDWE